jgi:hypothetical protein
MACRGTTLLSFTLLCGLVGVHILLLLWLVSLEVSVALILFRLWWCFHFRGSHCLPPVTVRYFYSKHGLFLLLEMFLSSIVTSNLICVIQYTVPYFMKWLQDVCGLFTEQRSHSYVPNFSSSSSKMFPNKMPANKTRCYPKIRTEKILFTWPIKSCTPPK